MKLPLREDWQSKVSGKSKVYPLGIEDREIVDKTFDEMHRQGRLIWTNTHTPLSYPVFVVWKKIGDVRKGRAVVDIRGLNDLLVPDAYPVHLQSDVIADLRGCTHISVLDANSFFYQWRVHPEDTYKQTIVTHRGQETFLVPVMGNRNSIAYVQRQMDTILRDFRDFVKAYIDDVVVRSTSLDEHLMHLRKIFSLFEKLGISIKLTKAFLGYSDVDLLGQRVNSLGMSTSEEKLRAISLLKFPKALIDLEHYLGLTGYLRSFIYYYAGIARPLQDLKTHLLRASPKGGQQRRNYTSRTKIIPTEKENSAFITLQKLLSKPSILIHFSPHRILWIDLDASKDFGYGVIVFHVKVGVIVPIGKWPSRNQIEPIMFLSRLLTAAEKNYWPTELEMAGLVWTIKKVRHLVQSSEHPTIVQTDHSAIIEISKQKLITATTSTMRMNVRLIRASQFLSQFRLDIRHKPGKEHIIPDALSRLASANVRPILADDHSELDVLYVYNTTVVEMSNDFRKRLIAGYSTDKLWINIIQMIDTNDKLDEGAAKIPFARGNTMEIPVNPAEMNSTEKSTQDILPIGKTDKDLIYHIDRFSGIRRLCIPASCVKDIFAIAHGNGHPGFARCYEIVTRSWYVRNLVRTLRE